MKLAGVCIILLALATASYAASYSQFQEREEMANQQDALVELLQKLNQQQQQLQENQAVAQQNFLDIIGSLLGGLLG